MKKVFDLLLALFLLFLLSPVFLLVIVLTKCFSSGDVFFVHTRVGLNGKTFEMYKFRTMVAGADKMGSYMTVKNDHRITKIGKYLRLTSVDELPQIINVIKGDMSFVGPRPHTQMQIDQYSEADWSKRCSVKPGITGLAQAKVRSHGNHHERLALDLEYVDNNNFFIDIWILFLTLIKLLSSNAN